MLTQDRLKQFCKMCTIKLYKPGSVVSIKNGGVILRGCLQKLTGRVSETDSFREEPIHVHQMSAGMQAAKNQLKKADDLKKLGQKAKNLEIHALNQLKICSVSFVFPDPNADNYVAFDTNYTAFLHFAPAFVQALSRGSISNDNVRDAAATARINRHYEDANVA